MAAEVTSLLPTALVEDLRALSAAEVVQRYEYTLFLLVELSNPENELAATLARTARTKRKAKRKSIDGLTTLEIPVFSNVTVGEVDWIELLAKLQSSSWFVVPLLKRSENDSAEILGVGRAAENDVVLNDRSISAHHAFFETFGDGSLSLTDNDSTNGTRVNGQRLAAKDKRWLQPMDHIQFGKVSTFTCIPAVLRSVLRTERVIS